MIIAVKNLPMGNLLTAALSQKGFAVMNVSPQIGQLQDTIVAQPPDYLLIGATLQTPKDGLAICEQIKSVPHVATKCMVMFSGDTVDILGIIEADISAYLYEDATYEEIQQAIACLKQGKRYISPAILKNYHHHLYESEYRAVVELLGKRELEIFVDIGHGYTVPAIAEKHFVSPKTIESHKTHICTKLGLQSVRALRAHAMRIILSRH